MVIRIRLSRYGGKNNPFYRVMAAGSRSPRDRKHLECLGFCNPLEDHDLDNGTGIDIDRVRYWFSVGAQPSDPVQRALFQAGLLLPPPPILAVSRKGGPRGRYSKPESSAADKQRNKEKEEAVVEAIGS